MYLYDSCESNREALREGEENKWMMLILEIELKEVHWEI